MNNPLVQPDPGLYFWTIIVFLILAFLLFKFAWRPLLAMLEKRESGIRQSLVDAEKAREELANVKADTEKILAEARMESQEILAASKKNAKKMKEDIVDKAQTKSEALIEDARKQIQIEKDRAISDVRSEVVNLSFEVAEKLIKKNLTKDDNLKLVEESLKNINQKNEA